MTLPPDDEARPCRQGHAGAGLLAFFAPAHPGRATPSVDLGEMGLVALAE
jgi:hypothetical protein